MIEKTNTEPSEEVAPATQRHLNQRILALYDQIERATLDNLELARKNSELEIQIETIDQVIRTHRQQPPTHPLPQP